MGVTGGYLRTYAFPHPLASATSALILKTLGLAGTQSESLRAIQLRREFPRHQSMTRELTANRPEPEPGLAAQEEL